MQVAEKSVVSFHYKLYDSAGQMLESSDDGEPTLYLHGANNIIRGLEEAMLGHSVGDSFDVALEPEQAYGLRNEKLQQRVPIKHLIFRGKLKAGMVVQVNTEQGQRSVTVVKAGRHSADIDSNHPLAGQALRFEISIVDVRPADPEELTHGHAHGPGGHQH